MLFCEPFFALCAFPAFYAVYLWFNDRARAKKWALILGSVAFYAWGEPLFVPVVLASSRTASADDAPLARRARAAAARMRAVRIGAHHSPR